MADNELNQVIKNIMHFTGERHEVALLPHLFPIREKVKYKYLWPGT